MLAHYKVHGETLESPEDSCRQTDTDERAAHRLCPFGHCWFVFLLYVHTYVQINEFRSYDIGSKRVDILLINFFYSVRPTRTEKAFEYFFDIIGCKIGGTLRFF